MIPLKYPTDAISFNRLKADYVLAYPDIAAMQRTWARLRRVHISLGVFPPRISDIMRADYRQLRDIYMSYRHISKTDRHIMKDDLTNLFNYDGYHDIIKAFFINPTNGFEINTCHYCDMTYVNVYSIDPTEDGLYFMNTASNDELKTKLNTKSDRTINKICANRPYNNIEDFKRVGRICNWGDNKFDKTFKPSVNRSSHFDIEHVLDKGSCPIIALSLMNLVPTCQVCNSRLKKRRVLGKNGVPEEKLSPTSPLFDFDNGVTIRILSKPGIIKINPTQHRDDYYLKFDVIDKDYEYFVNLFKLEERYSYHKIEALRWIELKQKYTDARLIMMYNALSKNPDFTVDKIREDIFGSDFSNNEHRCLSKMKRDVLQPTYSC